jgi:hypothetical protein
MSKDMKLIIENWRGFVNEQERVEVNTVGQLKKLLKGAVIAKRQGTAAEEGPKAVLDAFLDLVPGVASVKNIGSLLKAVYSMPDEKKTQTGLDFLNIDDQISAIVDDKVENGFIKFMLHRFDSEPDDTPLSDFDMTKEINTFLDKRFHGRTVNTPSGR